MRRPTSVDLRVVMEEVFGEEVDRVIGPGLHTLHERSAQCGHHVLHKVAAQRLRLQLERRELLALHLFAEHTHILNNQKSESRLPRSAHKQMVRMYF